MFYKSSYKSIVGTITLISDENNIIGLWLEGQKEVMLPENLIIYNDNDILKAGKKWLDDYFSGNQPSIDFLPLSPLGTPFQKDVWEMLKAIPYGKTTTYGEIAKVLAKKYGKEKFSAQAVGGAVGKNQISIIIPCHRVVGTNGNLTGYAGGIDKKITLLKHENVDISKSFIK